MWRSLPWRLRGYLITGAGVLLLSPDALFVKDTQVDVATFMFWRALLLGLVLALVAGLRYGRELPTAIRACGPAVWWCPLGFAASAWAFVIATRLTAAGNVLVMLNLAPLVAGLIGMLFFGQHLRRQTWVVIVLCVFGASLMAAGEIGQGSALGLIVALIAPVAVAVNTTVASAQRGQSRRGVDTTVILPLGCLAMLLPALLLGGAQIPPTEDFVRLAWMGLVFLPGAYFLIQTGTRYLPGAEVGLVMLLETLIGTLLVWWRVGEAPSALAFVGGGLILSAMLGSSMRDLHRQRRKAAAGAPDPQALLQQEGVRGEHEFVGRGDMPASARWAKAD
ncbi:Permease of the drug/metabolite transporter (DMT) superfamily [Modicisalibacter ilicicola DSM 19980]|uniref:Permease of the drug/metabolite transporter (DMT) superfamily n=1 Tax=Modicisalibacter ilicicola DSM 19980 TaxID=1121942 RepID=A0A1M4ZQ94_9GAMM|nr:DMT family transporter [Halomonas ilicicola]SHF19967.1 Permease of the drug/metabolite transporter (DMT) superfamily [Halomonas ilicicola DSM 19980]